MKKTNLEHASKADDLIHQLKTCQSESIRQAILIELLKEMRDWLDVLIE